ncbi:MAG: amidase family protein, partial [Gemmatimonadaceae bacterium]
MQVAVTASVSAQVAARVAAPTAATRSAATRATAASVEVVEATITDLDTALAKGRVTSLQLVDAYLARIAAYDHAGPGLNALIRLNPNARKDAAARDLERKQGHVRGPLHGIPIIIKDNYDTGDMPTSAGSLALANSQPAQDAFVVTKLRDAGAIIIAKSNMHELAAGITSISSLGGQTRNPYDLNRCPGGSSGGTGAAIAASFATVGWGSDTCGSIRIPSAFGSLFGLRPTQGLVSRKGIVPLSHTQDIGGPLARTATDLAIALDVTVGLDEGDSVTRVLRDRPVPRFQQSLDRNALRTARIGVLLPYFTDTDVEIADTVRAAITAMRAQGATIIQLPVPEFDTLIAGTRVIDMETKFDLAEYLKGVPNAPVHSLHEILDRGLYDKALEVRFRTADTASSLDSDGRKLVLRRQALMRARIERIMDSLSLDGLAYPTMKQKPVFFGEAQPGTTCALSAQTGLPAISFPAGFSADGLPIGIELLGRAFTDTKLVSLAYAFEQSGPRRRAPATTPALVAGRAPVNAPIVVRAATSRASASGRFVYDATHSNLQWAVTVAGVAPQSVQAVVLRRVSANATANSSNTSRVISRLLGPGMQRGEGVVTLNEADRRALLDGRLSFALYDQS